MKHLNKLLLVLVLMLPLQTQPAWYNDLWNWMTATQNRIKCLIFGGAACAVGSYMLYQKYVTPQRSENELKMLAVREQLITTKIDDWIQLVRDTHQPRTPLDQYAIINTTIDEGIKDLTTELQIVMQDTATFETIPSPQTDLARIEYQHLQTELPKLDERFYSLTTETIVIPIEALIEKKITPKYNNPGGITINEYDKDTLTPNEFITELERIKSNFVKEMAKLKKLGSTREPAQEEQPVADLRKLKGDA